MSFLAPISASVIRGTALIRLAPFLYRAGLLRWFLLRFRRIRAGLCLSRVRFFRDTLVL
ncbi:MAG: hypothetical protein ACM3KL_03045 [Alphaproteobacteria bacterium]